MRRMASVLCPIASALLVSAVFELRVSKWAAAMYVEAWNTMGDVRNNCHQSVDRGQTSPGGSSVCQKRGQMTLAPIERVNITMVLLRYFNQKKVSERETYCD